MTYPDHILRRNPPGEPHRSWSMEPLDYDPKYDVLMRCGRCKRKVGDGPLKALRIWHVRIVREKKWTRPGGPFGDGGQVETGVRWHMARVECADAEECETYRRSKERKQREAAERRRPKLPHADAPAGSCKWCGEEIRFDETRKGWKRRRQRGYHRGDEWELTDTNCLLDGMVWLDPKRGTQTLLERQEGKCAVCGTEIACLGEHKEWAEDFESFEMVPYWVIGPEHPRIDIDHVLPVVDGGTNLLENLQAICNDPCHKEKTAREARERAKARRAEGPPAPPSPQLKIA